MENNKYQNGKIYKIIDNGYNLCYYGSTIQLLCNRMGKHRNDFKTKTLKCSVKQIFDTYGLDNCKIELVENYSCNNKEELFKREGYYIKNNECVNKCIAGRKPNEYYQDNKEKLLLNMKEYYNENKDKCLKLGKKWIENNSNKFKAIQKKHYDKCGLERNERTKIICECGGLYPKRNKKIHFKTAKHINFINNN
jgi:hypothetical protein